METDSSESSEKRRGRRRETRQTDAVDRVEVEDTSDTLRPPKDRVQAFQLVLVDINRKLGYNQPLRSQQEK
jgi:hypothetical protein